MRKIKAIVKRPDERYGHVTNISDTLKNLQKTVGGWIETVTITQGVVMIVNEEGKLLDLPFNIFINQDPIVGTLIVVGADGDEFCDCPISMKAWKECLRVWGNLDE